MWPKCKVAQPSLTRQLLAVAADTPQRWAAIPLCTKPIGVATIELTKTKHDPGRNAQKTWKATKGQSR